MSADPSAREWVSEWFESEVIHPIEDFQDPSQEWRRLFSEGLGTFFLVLVAAGGGMMSQAFPDTISRTAAVTAPGLMVLAIILFMGKVSGAHLNPAVSLAFAALMLKRALSQLVLNPYVGSRRPAGAESVSAAARNSRTHDPTPAGARIAVVKADSGLAI